MQTVPSLIADLERDLSGIFNLMEIAEEEIADAMIRHPRHADRLWHSFRLLDPTLDLIKRTEPGYRAHARELLQRVANGQDTRPGTAMECIGALSETSKLAPLNTTGTGLYLRLWKVAGMPDLGVADVEHYEAIRGSTMDDAEAGLRRKLAVADRCLSGPIEHVQGCPVGI